MNTKGSILGIIQDAIRESTPTLRGGDFDSASLFETLGVDSIALLRVLTTLEQDHGLDIATVLRSGKLPKTPMQLAEALSKS